MSVKSWARLVQLIEETIELLVVVARGRDVVVQGRQRDWYGALISTARTRNRW